MGGSEDAIPGMDEPMYEKTEFSMFDGKLKGNWNEIANFNQIK